MAIKRIKKMILGLLCLILSTSALAYDFLPALAPALVAKKPRVERARMVVQAPIPPAIGVPARQLPLTSAQTDQAALPTVQEAQVPDQIARVNEKWVAAWLPITQSTASDSTKPLVSEWVSLPQPPQSASTDVAHPDLFAAAQTQMFAITRELKLPSRQVRFISTPRTNLYTLTLGTRPLEPEPMPPIIIPVKRDLQTVALEVLDPRPVMSWISVRPFEALPAAPALVARTQESQIASAVGEIATKLGTRSMLALPDPPKSFRGPVAIIADPRPEISWAIGQRHMEELLPPSLHVASARPTEQMPFRALTSRPPQPVIAPWTQPIATVLGRQQLKLPISPLFVSETRPLEALVTRPLLAVPNEPVWAARADLSEAISFRSRLLLPEAQISVPGRSPSNDFVARAEIRMPEAPKPVAERIVELINDSVSQIATVLLGRSLEPLPAAPVMQTAPGVTASAKETAPATISRQYTLGKALIASLQNRVESLDPMSAGDKAGAGGPSDSPAPTVMANPTSATQPVTINRSEGMSSELLRPMSPRPVFAPRPESYALSTPFPGQVVQPGSYCDPNFVGPPIRFAQTVDLRLDDLLAQLNSRFGVNFIVGPEVGKTPLNVKAGSIPWNVLLRSQLYVSGIRAECINNDTIQLVLNNKVGELEKGLKEGEKLETRYIKLKYLQPSSGGNQNVAGQNTGGGGTNQGSQGGQSTSDCQQGASGSSGGSGFGGGGTGGGAGSTQQLPQRCKFERLMTEIRQMLGLNGQNPSAELLTDNSGPAGQRQSVYKLADETRKPYVGQVPGRNMLIVNAAPSQLDEIQELIKHADVPPFQVVVKALIYTANEDKLKDIGVQTTIVNVGNGKNSGSFIGHTLGSGSLFDLSTIIGTVQFDVQASALQQNGVISVKSRPFAAVLDGDTTLLTVGRQVPVVVTATNNFGGNAGTVTILQAANQLSVTPHVIDDDHGNPVGVNLELRLESNDTDAPTGQGIPTVQARSIQSNFNLNQDQTAILGGFTVDSDNKTLSKTPGLGDVPILGELFKRRVRTSQINRLYFAISVEVIPYGGPIEPVQVPGSSPDPPTITPTMLKRAEAAEPPKAVPSPTPKH